MPMYVLRVKVNYDMTYLLWLYRFELPFCRLLALRHGAQRLGSLVKPLDA